MRCYHGTPAGGTRVEATTFVTGRDVIVSFHRPDDLELAASHARGMIFDNGAFSYWKEGGELDVEGYTRWVEAWAHHPRLDFAVIPDVIGAGAGENDALVVDWPVHLRAIGAPVWHIDEPIGRFRRLCREWHRVCLAPHSSAYGRPGQRRWWHRIKGVFDAVCDESGRPPARLHGLGLMDPHIFTRLPLASADSTNAARNAESTKRFGTYVPARRSQRMAVIADRIEQHVAPGRWALTGQVDLFERASEDDGLYAGLIELAERQGIEEFTDLRMYDALYS